MNNIPFNPENWMDFVAILVVAGLAAFSSVYAARSQRMVSKLDKSINNGHSADQPLRGDVDEIRDTLKEIRGDLHTLKSELGDIRAELRSERKDRLELDGRFERFARRQI
jgi:peptidoglycan hydrolase CwlO-like protein